MKKRIITMLCLLTMFVQFPAVFADGETIDDKKHTLKECIDEINMTNVAEVATYESIETLDNALDNAKAVYGDSSADMESVLCAIENLKTAVENMQYISEKSILTNNAFSETEKKTYYPDTDLFVTTAEYAYNSGSEFNGLDTENTKMSNGLSDGYIRTSGVESVDVLYDLGDIYYITDVDIFSQFVYLTANKATHYNIGSFTVELSKDGAIYKKVSSAVAQTSPKDGEKNVLIQTSATFCSYLARYVKITVYCDENSAKYNLNEIVIRGFNSPFSKDELYDAILNCSNADNGIYTPQSYSSYADAYNKAKEVYWDNSTSGRAVIEAKDALLTAFSELEMNAQIKILSGNVRNDTAKNYYPGIGMDTVNLKYSYQDDSNPQIVSEDSSCTKLLQGNCDLLDASNMAFGKWDNAQPAKILFNMGEECYISGVDVWEYYNAAQTRVGWVRVYTSNDGKNFNEVSEIYNPKSDNDSKVSNCISQDFAPVKCRFLLVSVEKGSSHQIVLNEIMIKGFRIAEQNIPCKIGILEYKNSLGERITELDGSDVVISGNIESIMDYDEKIVIISIAYDKNNDMIDYSFTPLNLSAYGTAGFSNTLKLNGETDVEICSFVWNSLADGASLSDSKQFGAF